MYGIHLTGTQPLRIQRRQFLQPAAKRVSLIQPGFECFGTMKGKHFTRSRFWVTFVSEAGQCPRTFVDKRKWCIIRTPLQLCFCIPAGLLLYYGNPVPFRLFFRLDDPDGLCIDKKHIVRRPDVGLILPNGYAFRCIVIDPVLVLHSPTGSDKHCIDFITTYLFGGLVRIYFIPNPNKHGMKIAFSKI